MSAETNPVGLALFLLAAAGTVAYAGYSWLEEGRELDAFEPTRATVVSSGVEDIGRRRTRYAPRVEYRYRVDGTEYTGTNVRPGGGRVAEDAERIVENHPEGAVVTAYYDPEDPSEAFLLKERSRTLLLIGGIGVFVLAVGSLAAYRSLS